MPTDLPPDYKPKPASDPKLPGATPPPEPGEDVRDGGKDVPQPGPGGTPGRGADVVDPPGWREPPVAPGDDPIGVPTPAGTPTF